MGEGGGILKIVLKISDEVDIGTKPRVTWCYMQVDVDLARKLSLQYKRKFMVVLGTHAVLVQYCNLGVNQTTNSTTFPPQTLTVRLLAYFNWCSSHPNVHFIFTLKVNFHIQSKIVV